jgi:hypothetical protein
MKKQGFLVSLNVNSLYTEMNKQQSFVNHLEAAHFWDIDFHKIDVNTHKRLIIERIINFGSLREMNALIMYYGLAEIIQISLKISYLDPKTLNFISKLFEVPKSSFKCYTSKLSNPKLWNS